MCIRDSLPNGHQVKLKVRSMVGLIPLFAVETLEPELLDRLPNFKRRLKWFLAVSYTHLDVYKRQIEGIAKAPLAVGMAMCIAPFLIRTRTPTLIPWGVIFDERGFAGVAPIGSGEMIAL